MAEKKFIMKERVALSENISYRGAIIGVYPGGNNGAVGGPDQQMYIVQWDKDGSFLYLGTTIIPEKEAIERQTKIDAEKNAIDNKFKEMAGAISKSDVQYLSGQPVAPSVMIPVVIEEKK